jgi:hypothetical protein
MTKQECDSAIQRSLTGTNGMRWPLLDSANMLQRAMALLADSGPAIHLSAGACVDWHERCDAMLREWEGL